MDPLEKTHEHIHGLVLQHFTVDEILEYSTVSTKWYKLLGKSIGAMSKVWLNVGDRFKEPQKDDLKAFRASERNYQNFKISEIENGLQILLFPRRHWKRAMIDVQSFLNLRDFVNLLEIVNETINELEIIDMDIEYVNFDHSKLNFRHLTKLKIGYVTSVALKPFQQNLKKLKKLVFETITDSADKSDDSAGKMMRTILNLQSQLTHFSLTTDAFCKLFEEDNSYDFQLTYLNIEYSGNCENENSKKLIRNLKNFISTQKSLKWVTLCEWTCADIVKQLFACLSIERVSFDYFDNDSKKLITKDLKLNSNPNIQHVDFDCEDLNFTWIKPFLEALPEVTTLYFFHVTQEILEYLIANMKQLKTIKYCSAFENFQQFCDNSKSEKIKLVEEKFLYLREII